MNRIVHNVFIFVTWFFISQLVGLIVFFKSFPFEQQIVLNLVVFFMGTVTIYGLGRFRGKKSPTAQEKANQLDEKLKIIDVPIIPIHDDGGSSTVETLTPHWSDALKGRRLGVAKYTLEVMAIVRLEEIQSVTQVGELQMIPVKAEEVPQ